MKQNAFVTSELDLNDSLLNGSSKQKIRRQCIQKCSSPHFCQSREIACFPNIFFYVFTGCHFTRELIEFKILLVTLKVLHVFIKDRNSLI